MAPVPVLIVVSDEDRPVTTTNYVRDDFFASWAVVNDAEIKVRVFLTVKEGAESIWVPVLENCRDSTGRSQFLLGGLFVESACVYDGDREAIDREVQTGKWLVL